MLLKPYACSIRHLLSYVLPSAPHTGSMILGQGVRPSLHGQLPSHLTVWPLNVTLSYKLYTYKTSNINSYKFWFVIETVNSKKNGNVFFIIIYILIAKSRRKPVLFCFVFVCFFFVLVNCNKVAAYKMGLHYPTILTVIQQYICYCKSVRLIRILGCIP